MNIMLRAASKALLRVQATTASSATRYASRPWYRTIRPCSSSSNSIGLQQQEEKRLIEHNSTSTHGATFHQAAAAPASGFSSPEVSNAAQDQNVEDHMAIPLAVEGGAQVAVAEVHVNVSAVAQEVAGAIDVMAEGDTGAGGGNGAAKLAEAVGVEVDQPLPEVEDVRVGDATDSQLGTAAEVAVTEGGAEVAMAEGTTEVVREVEAASVEAVGVKIQAVPEVFEGIAKVEVEVPVVNEEIGANVAAEGEHLQPVVTKHEGHEVVVTNVQEVTEGVAKIEVEVPVNEANVAAEGVQPVATSPEVIVEGGPKVEPKAPEVLVGDDAKLEAETAQLRSEMYKPEDVKLPKKKTRTKSDVEADEYIEEVRASRKRGDATGDVAVDPILMQPKATLMLRKLGLQKFVRTRPPKVDKELCDEFLASALHRLRNGYGMVHGRMVSITPEAIHRVTGLPLGVYPFERRKTQGKFVTSLGTRVYKNCYDLKTVKLSENEEENQVLVALAELLTRKMGLFPFGEGRVAGPIMWGVHESWHGKNGVQWAAYMAELLRQKAERSRSVDRNSRFGGWLTAVIVDARADVKLCKDEDELLKIKLEQVEQKKRMLEAKEKELQQRELKFRKHVSRCNRYARALMGSVARCKKSP